MGYTTAMFKDCVLVSVKCSKPGNSRKVEEGTGEWKRASKKLLDAPEYDTICSVETATRKWFKVRAVPGEFFREGCYLLNKSYVEESKTFTDGQRQSLADAVSGLLSVYDLRIGEARQHLEPLGLFDAEDYPTPADWQSKCRIKVSYTEITVPEDLKAIDPELYAQQIAEADAEWARAIQDVRLALRSGMQEIVAKLCERLTPNPETGTAASIKTSTFNKLTEFMEHFSKRDITGDLKMAELVKKARQVLGSVDAEQVRTDAQFSAKIKASFDALKSELVEATEEQAVRLIEFDNAA